MAGSETTTALDAHICRTGFPPCLRLVSATARSSASTQGDISLEALPGFDKLDFDICICQFAAQPFDSPAVEGDGFNLVKLSGFAKRMSDEAGINRFARNQG